MKKVLSVVTILCILSVLLLTCSKPVVVSSPTKGKPTTNGNIATTTTTAAAPTTTTPTATDSVALKKADVVPGNITEAFAQVVQVLHAPYAKGDLLFRHVITGGTAINETSQGTASEQIGTGTATGNGEWTVTGAAITEDTNTSIVYEYKAYQPKGSDISITGTMQAMYRFKDTTNTTNTTEYYIGFNKTAADSSKTAYETVSSEAMQNAWDTYQANTEYKAYQTADTESDTKMKAYQDWQNTTAGKGVISAGKAEIEKATQYTNMQTAITAVKTTEAAYKDTNAYKAYRAANTAYYKAIEKFKQTFNQQHIDTLNITGAYDATLIFTYEKSTIYGIPTQSTDYNISIINQLLTQAEAKVAFTYNNETIELTEDQLTTLLQVSSSNYEFETISRYRY